MFEQTMSFWRRFVSATPAYQTANDTSTSVQEERRLWVRYEADAAAQLQLAEISAGGRVAGRIRNISLGGAKLVVDRAFKPGQMLTLDLASLDGQEIQSVLACIIHVAPDGPGQWILGCVFSRPLAPEDLEKIGAQGKNQGENEQRAGYRFPCKLKAQYQRIGAGEDSPHSAEVLNISANGIGLQLSNHVEVGALLQLDLLRPSGEALRTILACVVHSTQHAGGEQAVGCNFIRALGEEELKTLL